MTHIIHEVRPHLPEFGADLVRAVGVALDAAAELAARAVLLAAPDVLGVAEGLGLGGGVEVVVVGGQVLEEGRLVLLAAGRARGATVHEDGETTTGGEAGGAINLGIGSDDAREHHVEISE